jgi:hypothetical protein
MEVDQTLVHTDMPRLDRYLDFPLQTHPSALQLGGGCNVTPLSLSFTPCSYRTS